MTFVKICGITNLDDALCAVDAGADLLGFIFYPPSPRGTTVDAARMIVHALRHTTLIATKRCVTLVGVFVKETPADIQHVLGDVGLDAAQLHGNDPADARAMQGRGYLATKTWPVTSALGVMTPTLGPDHLETIDAAIPSLMLDANHPTLWGGSGQRADESLAAQVARAHRLLLAGGLTPDNVADAVRAVRPWGVDVASGTEASPGKKDHALVRAFVQNAKSAV